MMDIPKLYSLLENATAVDEEEFDVRFEEVVSLVDQERLDEASTLIASILKKGTVDLRLVLYLFYAQFIDQGISSLNHIFPAIKKILNEHWEKISPVNMRDKYLISGLTWFLTSIGKKIKRSEKLYKSKKTDEFWTKSVDVLTAHTLDQLVTCTREFAAFLIKKIDEPTLQQSILFVSKWLENLKSIVEEEKSGAEISDPDATEQPGVSPVMPKKAPLCPNNPLCELLSSSDAILHFYKKIQAFEALIEKKKFEKAALIADDIGQTIKNFDPSVFFPKLFSKYFALSATHIETLSQEWEYKTTLKWEALHRLYQTDLDEFIQW